MLHDTVVIEGEVSLINQIDGDPDVCIGAGGGSQPTGTKSILLTEAGTKTEDVTAYASAEINAVKDATASGAVASFSDGAEDVPMDSCLVQIEPVQSGSGDPSPSNIRPISGWSEVKVNVSGINVWDEEWELGYWRNGNKASSNSNIRSKNKIPILPNTDYYLKITSGFFFTYYDENGNFLSLSSYDSSGRLQKETSVIITTPDNAYYMTFNLSSAYGTTYNNNVSINYPSTDTEYHAYTGQTYPISLGQTVYGGTLDVVTGELTVDRGMVDLGTLNWTQLSGYIQTMDLSSVIKIPASNTTPCDIIAEQYIASTWAGTVTNGVAVANSGAMAISRVTSASGHLCYELATPQTYQLTPTEVTTLLGSNNVWADSGDIEVEYKADVYLTEGSTPTGTKQISIVQNGTTTEDVTNYASAEINVNVPASAVDTGTKAISSNGTHDVVGYASANVQVPNSYSQSDEGKVVSNGALVAQTSDTVTANDTYDTTLIDELTVNVPTGGGKVTKTLTNILGNTTTLTQGFFANNGSISAPVSPRNEVTTDFIDVSAYQGQEIYFWSKAGGTVAPWVSLFWYNSEKTSIGSRVSPLVTANNAYTWNSSNTGFCHTGSAGGSFASGSLLTVPSTAVYLRASFRTGGAGMMCAVLASEITPYDYWSREIDEIAFVNAIESDGSAT